MKNHISLFIFAIALLSGPVSANDLSMTAVKDTLASIPGEHNYISQLYTLMYQSKNKLILYYQLQGNNKTDLFCG